jgi:hypothetical protein
MGKKEKKRDERQKESVHGQLTRQTFKREKGGGNEETESSGGKKK